MEKELYIEELETKMSEYDFSSMDGKKKFELEKIFKQKSEEERQLKRLYAEWEDLEKRNSSN